MEGGTLVHGTLVRDTLAEHFTLGTLGWALLAPPYDTTHPAHTHPQKTDWLQESCLCAPAPCLIFLLPLQTIDLYH